MNTGWYRDRYLTYIGTPILNMGIIKKQSIQSTIYAYMGVGLGFLNSSVLLPMLLSEEQVGLLYFLNSFTAICATLCTLGIPFVTIKLFPILRNESNSHNGFFAFSLLMTVTGSLVGLLIWFLFYDSLISDKNTARTFAPFLLGFSILFIFRVVAKNFDSYLRMLMNTVLGAFLENFLLKLVVFISLVTYWWVNGYDFVILFFLYVLALALPGIVSTIYLLIKGDINLNLGAFRKANKGKSKEILSLSIYGLLGSLGSIIVLEVDRIMVSNMLGLEQNAVYATGFYFGLFCSIPARALKRIALAVIAQAWKEEDLNTIKDIYHKSSLTLFLFGVYLFLGVWVNIDYVFELLPDTYSDGKMVILLIGVAQLTDLITGINSEIIATSKYYRYTSYFISSLIVLVIILNYLLIPVLGIDGAAMASFISIVIFNLMKFIFLYCKLRYQPLNYKFLLIILIGALALFSVSALLPAFENIYLGILVTGSVLTVIYWIPVYLLKISSDVNETIGKYLKYK